MNDMRRLISICEDAVPILGQRYYHGTNSLPKARSIWDNGLKPDQVTLYKGSVKPTKGMVYMTSSLSTAIKYALMKNDGPAYILAFSHALSSDTAMDEDAFDGFIANHVRFDDLGQPFYRPRENDGPADKILYDHMITNMTVDDLKVLTAFRPPRPKAAKICKALQKTVPLDLQHAWINQHHEGGRVSIAHRGVLMPEQLWEIENDLARSMNLIKANVEDYGKLMASR